jgi:hypothetical protein
LHDLRFIGIKHKLFHRTLHLISQNAFKRNLQKVKTVAGATLFGGAERGADSNAGGIGGMGFFWSSTDRSASISVGASRTLVAHRTRLYWKIQEILTFRRFFAVEFFAVEFFA